MGCHRPRGSACVNETSHISPASPFASHPCGVKILLLLDREFLIPLTPKILLWCELLLIKTLARSRSRTVRQVRGTPSYSCGLGSWIVRLLHRDYCEKYEWQLSAECWGCNPCHCRPHTGTASQFCFFSAPCIYIWSCNNFNMVSTIISIF